MLKIDKNYKKNNIILTYNTKECILNIYKIEHVQKIITIESGGVVMQDEKLLQLRRERKQRIVDVVRQTKKPDRVPVVSNAFTWKIIDAGVKFSEAFNDLNVMRDVVIKHHEKYDFDGYFDYGIINAVKFGNTLGKGGCFVINDELNTMNFVEKAVLQEDEYPELIEKGFKRYIFEKLLPRKYQFKSREEAFERLKAAKTEYDNYYNYIFEISGIMNEQFGVPDLAPMWYYTPFEFFPWALRGLRRTGIDMRRRPDQVEAALQAIDEFVSPSFYDFAENERDSEDHVFAHAILMMAHSILNPKQFERYYWPHLKRYVDLVIKKDEIAVLYSEASVAHLIDFFQEIPKGHFALICEQDDPRFLKEKLPNLTVIGGFPTSLLGNGTVEQCITEARKLIDDMAYDGNYIFSANKMLSFANDANSENMLALNQFVKEYGVFHS